jgi:hypothetical protein
MANAFLYRSQAWEFAVKQGWQNFRTKFDPNSEMWKVYPEKDLSPAAEWAKGKDFVAWVETAWVGGTEDRVGECKGVVIVSISKDELKAENIPTDFIIEPITPSLWVRDVKRQIKDVSEHREWTKRENVTEEKDERPSTTRRKRSTVQSIVWETAERIVQEGGDRNAVIVACVAAGVQPETAATYYANWKKAKTIQICRLTKENRSLIYSSANCTNQSTERKQEMAPIEAVIKATEAATNETAEAATNETSGVVDTEQTAETSADSGTTDTTAITSSDLEVAEPTKKKPGRKPKVKVDGAETSAEPKERKKRKRTQECRNGVTRPKPDTAIGKLWSIADAMSQHIGRPVHNKELMSRFLSENPDANKNMANTQYSRWKRFYGVNEVIKNARAEATAVQKAREAQHKAEEKAKYYAEKAEAAKRYAEQIAVANAEEVKDTPEDAFIQESAAA